MSENMENVEKTSTQNPLSQLVENLGQNPNEYPEEIISPISNEKLQRVTPESHGEIIQNQKDLKEIIIVGEFKDGKIEAMELGEQVPQNHLESKQTDAGRFVFFENTNPENSGYRVCKTSFATEPHIQGDLHQCEFPTRIGSFSDESGLLRLEVGFRSKQDAKIIHYAGEKKSENFPGGLSPRLENSITSEVVGYQQDYNPFKTKAVYIKE